MKIIILNYIIWNYSATGKVKASIDIGGISVGKIWPPVSTYLGDIMLANISGHSPSTDMYCSNY